jgi:hypothetical protein
MTAHLHMQCVIQRLKEENPKKKKKKKNRSSNRAMVNDKKIIQPQYGDGEIFSLFSLVRVGAGPS